MRAARGPAGRPGARGPSIAALDDPLRRWAAALVAVLVAALVAPVMMATPALAEVEVVEEDPPILVRFAGEDRFETAADIALDPFVGGEAGQDVGFETGTVVVARADVFADALTGSVLAGATRAPIVLTPSDTTADQDQADNLNPELSEVLDTYGPDTVYVLGGVDAVGQDVVDAIDAKIGDGEVVRIGGQNRFETAQLVAESAVALAAGDDGDDGDDADALETSTAIVATGGNFPDALVAGALAAGRGVPILLNGPELGADGRIDPFTSQALTDLGIEDVIIAGGDAVVGDDVADAIGDLVDGDVERVAGDDRFATAVAFAETLTAEGNGYGFSSAHYNLADGGNFPDALALGPHAGLDFVGASPILLTGTDTLAPQTQAYLANPDNIADDFVALHVAGGVGAVSADVATAARQAAIDGGAPTGPVEPGAPTIVVTASETTTTVNTLITVTADFENVPEGTDVTFTTETATVGTPPESSTANPFPAEGTDTVDADGVATFAFTSSLPGPVDVTATATVDGTAVSDEVTVTFAVPEETAYVIRRGGGGQLLLVQNTFGANDDEADEELVAETATALQPFDSAPVAMDVQPGTGQIYALDGGGTLYTVGTDGTVTDVGTGTFTGGSFALGVGMDFVPGGEAIRVVNGTNHYVVELAADGSLGDVAQGEALTYEGPEVPEGTGLAYTTDALGVPFVIDSAQDVLAVLQVGDGTQGDLVPVGPLGVDALGPDNGFDISLATGAAYAALNDGTTTTLYVVDLLYGGVLPVGEILRDDGVNSIDALDFLAFAVAPSDT